MSWLEGRSLKGCTIGIKVDWKQTRPYKAKTQFPKAQPLSILWWSLLLQMHARRQSNSSLEKDHIIWDANWEFSYKMFHDQAAITILPIKRINRQINNKNIHTCMQILKLSDMNLKLMQIIWSKNVIWRILQKTCTMKNNQIQIINL